MATDRLKKKIGKGRHASTIKRERQSEVQRVRNRTVMTHVKTVIKDARIAKTKEAIKAAIPVIAKAAQKGVVHAKKASRLISRLTKLAA